MECVSRHQCLIYHGPSAEQVPTLAAMMQQKLAENYRCLYLSSPAMVSAMRAHLTNLRVSIVDEVIKSSLILSSDSTLDTDGNFDVDLMLHKLEDALDRALDDGYRGLWATGDMTWEFGDKKNFAKLLEYEWRLEALFQRRPELHGVCQYHHDTLPVDFMRKGLMSHKTLFINETLSNINPHYVQSKLEAEKASANSNLDKIIGSLCESQAAG